MSEIVKQNTEEEKLPLEILHAADLFSKLPDEAQNSIIDLIKSLLSEK